MLLIKLTDLKKHLLGKIKLGVMYINRLLQKIARDTCTSTDKIISFNMHYSKRI